MKRWRHVASLLLYAAIAAFLGRDVLARPGSRIAGDVGDALFTTGLLHWNATHVPYSDAWYQFPIFYPTRDTLTFSEHLLGISVIATPLHWLTGNPVLTYNVTLLLTFVFSAAAMYALVWRLTRNVYAAFIAGLAFGFAPYRVSQLPHVQMLAAFYAPLALVGLHAFLETGRRRWLALYGSAWVLQAAANGYMLVFFSVLIGLWLLWFVVARRRWATLAMIGIATALAILPLVPILLRYVQVHEHLGLVRGLEEIKYFSADIAALACAPPALTLWGWIRVGCRPEGELFPGVALSLLAIGATAHLIGRPGGATAASTPRAIRIVTRVLIGVAVLYALIALSVWWIGPWRFAIGPLHASASSALKSLLVSVASVAMALLAPMGARLAALRSSTTAFYLLGAAASWILALGPRLRLMDRSIGYDGPFSLLMLLPGVDNLRVPARFWLVAVVCLCVAAGLFIATLLEQKRRRPPTLALVLLAFAVLGDGWSWKIPTYPLPPDAPDTARLRGRAVLELPIGAAYDIDAGYRAVQGGWHGVNGYSGYGPSYYDILREGLDAHADSALGPLRELGAVEVLVRTGAAADQEYIRRQPGVQLVVEDGHFTHFTLSAQATPATVRGAPLHVERLAGSCAPDTLPQAIDGNLATGWACASQQGAAQITADLGGVHVAGAVTEDQGTDFLHYPRAMTIETSIDGSSWQRAWSGDVWGVAVDAAMRDPTSLQIVFPFDPREARYIRLTHPAQERAYTWTLADLGVWTK